MTDIFMAAIDGRTALLLLAILIGLIAGLCATPRARRTPPPVVLNHPHRCTLGPCGRAGHWPVTSSHGREWVCRDHYELGLAEQWWGVTEVAS